MLTTDLEYEIGTSKDDYPTLRIKRNDKWTYIGSKYNMSLEINKFLEKFIDIDDEDIVLIVYGAGTGKHIEALKNKYKKNKILVFEPNTKVYKYIIDNKVLCDCDNVAIFSCEIDELSMIVQKFISEINLKNSKIECFSNYDTIYLKEYSEFLKEIKRCFVNIVIDKSTKINYSRRWFETLMNNLEYMIEGIPAELYENKYKNKPAVIVSAGPSLEKNIDCLKDTNAMIISGGRTLRSLIDKGIEPDLLTVIDPNEVSYALCEGYLADLNKPLLFFEGSSDKVVAEHKGKKLFFTNNKFINEIVERDLKPIPSGGSVAHVMTSYAVMLGCNPIIFIGQDLAYTNEKSHASISQNRDGKVGFKELKREDDIYVEDINGDSVRTSLILNEYRRFLETIISNSPDTLFINATEGGAKIKGTIQMTLKEALEKYQCSQFGKFEEINFKANIKENALRLLKETKNSSDIIIKEYKKALNYLKEIQLLYKTKDVSKVNSIIKKIDKIDSYVNEQYKKISLLDSLMYPIIVDILSNKNKSDNKDEEIKQNEKFYSTIVNELQYSMEYIIRNINELES